MYRSYLQLFYILTAILHAYSYLKPFHIFIAILHTYIHMFCQILSLLNLDDSKATHMDCK